MFRSNPPDVRTGRKWNAEEKTDEAISAIQHMDIAGPTQRKGHGEGSFKQFGDMTTTERREAVTRQVEKARKHDVKLVQCSL